MATQKVIHKRSAVVDKTPSPERVDYGELIINYASGVGKTFFATKKNDDTIAKFHEDSYWDTIIEGINYLIENNAFVTAKALNDLNERVTNCEESGSGSGSGSDSGISNTYRFVMDENGVVRCVKNGTEEGFTISESGVVSLK